ncbi:MAG TPA: hypothetical protein V6D20_14865 [Candidatus Obscuribacterales bacterium]
MTFVLNCSIIVKQTLHKDKQHRLMKQTNAMKESGKVTQATRTKQLAGWTGAWLITMAIATFGPILVWEGQTVLTIIGILLSTAMGVSMILANIRHLKSQDELMQKIHLEAMGLALGVGVIGGLAYEMLYTAKVLTSEPQISYLVMAIALSYLLSTFLNQRRYR